MKKLFCLCLAVLVCFGMCGCQENHQPTAEDYEPIPMEETCYLYGRIEELIQPDMLEMSILSKKAQEKWGETVQVLAESLEGYCVGDVVTVTFEQAYRPKKEGEPIKVLATQIYIEDGRVYKPIIYFYPEADTVCSAKLMLNGSLTCTYPEHGANGWENFIAQPDGTLIFPDGKEYYALYWEGIQTGQWDFSRGFCVAGDDTAAFLEWALAQQGLTPREANEFIVYWLPILQENPYNVIAFQGEAYTDGAVLEIAPAPDSLLRIFMAYYPSDVEVAIEPQSFTPFVREGFTVVEWGGGQK